MPARLHLRHHPGGRFTWLSAPGAPALSLLFLIGIDPVTPGPRRVWLIGPDGALIDEAMACDHRGGVLVTCHGGPAVRRKVEEALSEAGFEPGRAEAFGHGRFNSSTLALLPHAQGAAAVTMILEAAGQAAALAGLRPEAVAGLLADSVAGRFLLNPPRVQLWGPVNAGKSSLLNALCGQQLAAVGDEPGLTRDVIEGRLEHEGFVLRVFDAPGVWAGGGALDAEAQRLAEYWRDQADRVLTLPGGRPRVVEYAGESIRYDIHDGGSLVVLKSRLVEHFFGPLRRLTPDRRFALHPDLRADLESGSLEAVKAMWL